jgi:hypothetical protein
MIRPKVPRRLSEQPASILRGWGGHVLRYLTPLLDNDEPRAGKGNGPDDSRRCQGYRPT